MTVLILVVAPIVAHSRVNVGVTGAGSLSGTSGESTNAIALPREGFAQTRRPAFGAETTTQLEG